VDLRIEDVDLLARACRKYKASLPSYLASAQADFERLQVLIDRFEALSSGASD